MPAKNSIKLYVKNGFYHIYNRGNNKAPIFFDEADYKMFLFFVKLYLIKPEDSMQLMLERFPKAIHIPKNFHKEITIVAFCLMPNHFHLLIKQTEPRTIEGFMRALSIRYAMYSKKKYDRTGHLFQDRYKGILITHDSYLLHLSRYIHLNPIDLDQNKVRLGESWSSYEDYPFSSYRWYIKNKIFNWFDPSPVLSFFASRPIWIGRHILSYQSFVSNYKKALPKALQRILLDS